MLVVRSHPGDPKICHCLEAILKDFASLIAKKMVSIHVYSQKLWVVQHFFLRHFFQLPFFLGVTVDG